MLSKNDNIIISGPGSKYIIQSANALYIGDGIENVTDEEIDAGLESAQYHSHVHFWAHGCTAVDPGTSEKFHVMVYKKRLATKTSILITKSNKSKAAATHIWGCAAGAVIKTPSCFAEDKPVILHSGDNNSLTDLR